MDPSMLMRMGVAYGHQNTCRCGDEHPGDLCVRANATDWWRCIAPDTVPDLPQGTLVATGDVGTVDEAVIFGGS